MSNKSYVLYNLQKNEFITFKNEKTAKSWQAAFPEEELQLVEAREVLYLQAKLYIDWNDVPSKFNFIFKDSTGVYASRFKPSKTKWFGQTCSIMRKYGGENVKLDYKPYHELMNVGDYYEVPNKNNHFIQWRKLKNSKFIKFIDNKDQIIEVFDHEGQHLFSGSNKDIQLIDKKNTCQFNTFLSQTYMFERDI